MFRDPIEKENSNLSVCPRPKRCSEWQCLFLSIADLRLMGVRAGRQVGFCFWQSKIFYLLHWSRWDSLLVAYVSAPACVRRSLGCQHSPRGMTLLSCMFLGTTWLRLWSVRSPVTMLHFHLAFPSLAEHERGCCWRWAEPLENLLRMAGWGLVNTYFFVQYLKENTENNGNRINCKPYWPFYLILNTMN